MRALWVYVIAVVSYSAVLWIWSPHIAKGLRTHMRLDKIDNRCIAHIFVAVGVFISAGLSMKSDIPRCGRMYQTADISCHIIFWVWLCSALLILISTAFLLITEKKWRKPSSEEK